MLGSPKRKRRKKKKEKRAANYKEEWREFELLENEKNWVVVIVVLAVAIDFTPENALS